MSHDIEPGFTGSRAQWQPPEVVRVATPFRVAIKVVDNITAGKITRTYFDWHVELQGVEIARRSIHSTRPRTRNAAIGQAKKAIRDWSEFVLSTTR